MVVNKDIEQYILIHNALKKKNLTQSYITEALGVSHSSISRYIYGTRKSTRFNQWVKENLGLDIPEHTARKREVV